MPTDHNDSSGRGRLRRGRDRHGRGLRGPLAAPNPLTERTAAPRRPSSRGAVFDGMVSDAVRQVSEQCPRAVAGIEIGIVDVPEVTDVWREEETPLATAVDATTEDPARIVLYRRPLEHRAISRTDLRTLVHRALAEQLAALTAIPIEEIAPDLG